MDILKQWRYKLLMPAGVFEISDYHTSAKFKRPERLNGRQIQIKCVRSAENLKLFETLFHLQTDSCSTDKITPSFAASLNEDNGAYSNAFREKWPECDTWIISL